MIDIIGKRRYGYILSSILTIVGAIFILGTLIPNGGIGLQFSIAYTGGTVWEIGFEDGTPDPNDVRAVLEEQGLTGEVAITEANEVEYVLIRTEALSLQAPDVVEGSAAAAVAAEQSAEPVGSTAPQATAEAVDTETTAEPAADATTEPAADATTEPAADATAEPAAAEGSPAPDASPAADAAAGDGEDDGSGPILPTEGTFGELATALQDQFGPISEVRQENSVGPIVSQELIYQTFLLVLMAAVAIMLWVAYRFRDVRMGATALIALFHDVIVTLGAFALLGTFIGLQVDSLFVTAMLTVIGFSVHDTIVVFDRIRENRQRFLGEPLEAIVNHSLVQTIGRSVTTSLTLVLTLLALLLFGGEGIRSFTLALLVGVGAGTYSSIFVATPLFLDWHLRVDKRKADAPADAKTQTLGA